MKFKKEFEWLRQKPLMMLFVNGQSVDEGGLFKGAWNPHTGGGFGGTGIAETTFRESPCMGWVIEKFIENNEKPDMIGFSHTPGAMQKWPLAEIMEA